MHKIYKNWKKALCILEGVIRRGSDFKLQIKRIGGKIPASPLVLLEIHQHNVPVHEPGAKALEGF